MSDFKGKLAELHDHAKELEAGARPLANQNLADIINNAVRKLEQALQHPDVDNIGREEAHGPALDPLNSGGNLQFAAMDPGRIAQDEEAARRAAFAHDTANRDAVTGQPFVPVPPANPAPFPGTTLGGAPVQDASKLSPDAKHPGDPSFVKPNEGFRDPHAVNLNDDGTLKQAPNTQGRTDERDHKPQGA